MSAAHALLAELRARGVALRVVGDGIRFRPKAAVTPELLTRMAACKEELLALIGQLEERAAIIEYDGGFTRAEAERRAKLFPELTEIRDPEASGAVGGPLPRAPASPAFASCPHARRTACSATSPVRWQVSTSTA